jgi:hypothetical protein
MMLKILNSRERKRLAEGLARDYGVDKCLFSGLDLLADGGNVWATARECLGEGLRGLKADSVGIQVLRDGTPTIYCVQLLFGSAPKIELSEEDAKSFIGGAAGAKEPGVAAYRGHPLDLAVRRPDGFGRPHK